MKNNYMLALLCLLVTSEIYAQVPRIQIVQGVSIIPPLYSKNAKTRVDTINLTLQISGAFDRATAANNQANLTFTKNGITVDPRFTNGSTSITISIPESKWPGADKTREISYVLYLAMPNYIDKIANDQIGEIAKTGDAVNIHTVRVSSSNYSTAYDPTKSFWVEVGANFDLVDGLEPNNLFSGVFFYKRDIRPFFCGKQNRLGMFAGIYESKTVTNNQEQNFSFLNYYDTSSLIPNVPDSAWIYKSVGRYVNSRVVRNVGMFLSPQFRISGGSANEDGLHFFASLWVDLQWQRVLETREFSQIRKLDSFKVQVDTLAYIRTASDKRETDLRSHYIGVGFPVFFRETTGENIVLLFLNPVFGISNQPMSDWLAAKQVAEIKNIDPPTRKWRPFYIVQFRLNEEQYGISFTGEVRGLISKNSQPYVSLALSKKFDLTKFMEFGKK